MLVSHKKFKEIGIKKLKFLLKDKSYILDIKNQFNSNESNFLYIMIKDPIFVAEIGMNADGIFENNKKLIKAAKYSGANIAKFQLGWRDGKEDINYLDEKRVNQLFLWGKI